MSTPQFDEYVAPTIEDSDDYKPHEHVGATVIVKVKEFKPSVVTPNSPDGGPAVIVDLVDLDTAQIYRNVLWMGGAFVDGLKDKAPGGAKYTGNPAVLGIISATSKSSGRKYGAPTAADPAQLQRATAYYAAKGDPFAQQFDAPTPAAAGKDEPPF